MTRTYVVTGSASGIGKATLEMLVERGHDVIGVDIAGADIVADLGTSAGRARMVDEVTELSHGSIDGVLAVAGLSAPTADTVSVNYFGTVATLDGLRPLLAKSPAPRAVAVSSMAALFPPDEQLIDALASGQERVARQRADELAMHPESANLIYGSTKRALSRWIRRVAPTPDWAGASIALNAIAPGVVRTPMTVDLTATAEGRQRLADMVPMPLNGFFEATDAAELLAWLAGEANAHMCGQIIYIDGGSDAVMRGDSVW
ncbi:SDR family oxidoreductase [Microbacterium oleivorans]|uniref:SDR family oxidoreductase n=1 Tax=Microbacterium oleivorans TaxID=273677 RepID=UPI0010A2F590|nr:SDR family oxidoreductase [Microbacterium oleivorans]THE07515.1 SDR family oxidoreductase [Microbacterium oleivorans]